MTSQVALLFTFQLLEFEISDRETASNECLQPVSLRQGHNRILFVRDIVQSPKYFLIVKYYM